MLSERGAAVNLISIKTLANISGVACKLFKAVSVLLLFSLFHRYNTRTVSEVLGDAYCIAIVFTKEAVGKRNKNVAYFLHA